MNIDPNSSVPAARVAVTGAVRNAAQLTGTNFRYLLATAKVESNLNPHSAASTSSAKGLFQFISQTWLATLKEQGPALGYGPYADAITKLPSGQYVVSDPALSQQIMNLRTDPTASAVMAGAFTKANASKLSAWLGRPPSEGELYIAHFLGPNGAAKLIELAQARPQTPAAQAFPGAANANRPIFFDRAGQPRSAADVYRILVGRYDTARTRAPHPEPATPAVAKAAPAPTVVGPPMPLTRPALALAPSRTPPAALPVQAPAPGQIANQVAHRVANAKPSDEIKPVFHSLFRTTERTEPLSPMVNALWSTPPLSPALQPPPQRIAPAARAAHHVTASTRQPPAPAPQPTAAPAPPAAKPGAPLDLFQEQAPNARALFGGRAG